MGLYMGRLVSHYTAGGHTDTCGHWHDSGFHYNWTVLCEYLSIHLSLFSFVAELGRSEYWSPPPMTFQSTGDISAHNMSAG
jgi:hypothetical protein